MFSPHIVMSALRASVVVFFYSVFVPVDAIVDTAVCDFVIAVVVVFW